MQMVPSPKILNTNSFEPQRRFQPDGKKSASVNSKTVARSAAWCYWCLVNSFGDDLKANTLPIDGRDQPTTQSRACVAENARRIVDTTRTVRYCIWICRSYLVVKAKDKIMRFIFSAAGGAMLLVIATPGHRTTSRLAVLTPCCLLRELEKFADSPWASLIPSSS